MLSSNEANIVAEVDGSTVYASQEDLDDLRESVELSITNITNIIQQVTGVDPDDPDAEPPSGSMVVTLMHTKSDTVHAFTGLGERTGLVPCQFKSTAGYTEGDTATIDGTAYTITLTGADDPETDLFVSGKSILVDVDTEGKLINFKSGGGLTKAKLALANATEDTVFKGYTFYAGSKQLRTGRAERGLILKQIFTGKIPQGESYTFVINSKTFFMASKEYVSTAGICIYYVNGVKQIQSVGLNISALEYSVSPTSNGFQVSFTASHAVSDLNFWRKDNGYFPLYIFEG